MESFPLNISCLGGGSFATWYLISKMMITMIMELMMIMMMIMMMVVAAPMWPGVLHDHQNYDDHHHHRQKHGATKES